MKPTYVISCPIDTYSGYGARSRDIVKSLIELNKYTIKIIPQRWGNTPWGFLNDNPEWSFLQKYLVSDLDCQPDIWSQITVPNEFHPIGKYNIGITAGIETTLCDPSWIEGINKMDLTIVPSEHSKQIFINTQYEKRDNNNNLIEEIKVNKPIEVLFEGVNVDIYKPLKTEEISIDLKEIKESFAYLFIGHWMQGEIGEDRKNVGLLVKSFYETFKNQKSSPALVLKTSLSGASYMDRKVILDKIHEIKKTIKADTLPNIYLLHGEFSDQEINELYNHPKIKAMVSLTKGEGFGRPLLEFTQCKKPIIATNWSGHIDFLNPKFTSLISGELKQVHPSAVVDKIILKESSWFSPDLFETGVTLHKVYNDYKSYKENSKKQAAYVKNRFTLKHMESKLDTILQKYSPNFPELVEIKLPELASL